MDVEFVDELKQQIDTLNEQQLSALWRWITIKYMSVCEQRLTIRAVGLCPTCRGKGKLNVAGTIYPCADCVGTGQSR